MEKMERFKTWLTKRGAVVLAPTNQWEVVRFKTVNGVSVVYTRANGHLTFTGESEKAYQAWKANKTWKAVDRKRKVLRAKKAKLASRDGKKCFACLAKLGFDELTIEHILSFSHGGTDNDNNLCLMCQPCNKLMSNKSITKKIETIIELRQSYLTNREKYILTMRKSGTTLKKIGEELGVQGERVRQIQAKAEAKIKRFEREKL